MKGKWKRQTGFMLIAAACILTAVTATAQQPAAMPGAVPVEPGSSIYLTSVPYEQVKAHYAGTVGNASREFLDGRQIYYTYDTATEGSLIRNTAIRITYGHNTNNAFVQVLYHLRGSVQHGFITADDLAEIQQQYGHLKDLFYRNTGSGPADHAVYQRYNNFISSGSELPHEQFMMQIQQLALQGKTAELQEMQQQMEQNVRRVQQLQTSREQVDFWIECLDEIDAAAQEHGFPVLIELEYQFHTSDSDKG